MKLNRRLLRFVLAVTLSCLSPGSASAGECKEHIELHGGAYWAKELGKPEMWVLANHHINLWQNPSPNKGKAVGKMRVGSRASIIESRLEDYRVKSPLDGSVGWVGKIQVSRTLWQDTETFRTCKAPR